MKKIKVLRIIARLNIGGPAIHTVLLSAYLDKNRFDTILVAGSVSPDEGDMAYYAAQHNVRPYYIPALKRDLNIFDDFSAFLTLFFLIKKERPAIVHTHTAKAGTLGRAAAILYNALGFYTGKRVILVHTFHGHVFSGYFSRTKTRVFTLIERILAFFTGTIITVSESVKEELSSLRIARPEKIRVIPLGFELEGFLKLTPEQKQGPFRIGIVGRLVPIKNHRLFLDAAAKVLENRGDEVCFKIIGDGELRSELMSYAQKLGIKQSVEFPGWERDLRGVYAALDVVALTSFNEGTPVSLIEAMAAARAIVATDVGGVRDLLGALTNEREEAGCRFKILERGILVASGDSDGFAAALAYLIANSEIRQRLGRQARDFASVMFRKERLIADITHVYESIVGYK